MLPFRTAENLRKIKKVFRNDPEQAVLASGRHGNAMTQTPKPKETVVKKTIEREAARTEDLIDLGAATTRTKGPFQKELDGVQSQGRIPAPLAD